MSVVEEGIKAPEAVAKGLIGLIKSHPLGALLVFGVLILVVLRFRNGIVNFFSMIPVVGSPAASFAGGGGSAASSAPPPSV